MWPRLTRLVSSQATAQRYICIKMQWQIARAAERRVGRCLCKGGTQGRNATNDTYNIFCMRYHHPAPVCKHREVRRLLRRFPVIAAGRARGNRSTFALLGRCSGTHFNIRNIPCLKVKEGLLELVYMNGVSSLRHLQLSIWNGTLLPCK